MGQSLWVNFLQKPRFKANLERVCLDELSIAAFHNLWVPTQNWVIKPVKLGCSLIDLGKLI